jgi:hypothetical protein
VDVKATSGKGAIGTFVGKVVFFAALTAALYLLVVFAAANGGPGSQAAIRRYTNIPVGVAQRGGSSLVRFQEYRLQRDLDILFVGSSHCYRSFDPRFYDARGLRTFNMGSTSQTPLNSYYLLRDEIGRLRPRLMVIELYWETLANDGLESFLDLNENLAMREELAAMALATRNPRAFNGLLARLLELDRPRVEEIELRLGRGDTYVEGGFVERAEELRKAMETERHPVKLQQRQLDYLSRLVELARDSGARVALVIQPVPLATRQAVTNLDEVMERLHRFAADRRVPLLDFNETMRLEPDDFFDHHHLSRTGADKFNRLLLKSLADRGLLPPA